jgi:hypothetical protein
VWTGHKKPGKTLIEGKESIKWEDSTPRLGKQLSHRGRLELCKKGTAMDTAKVTDIPVPIQLFCNNSES